MLPGPIKADSEPRFVFLSKLKEAAGMEKSEIFAEFLTGNDGDEEKVSPIVYAELKAPGHTKLVCSAV